MSHFWWKNRENHNRRCSVNLTGIYIAIWAILVRGVILTWPRVWFCDLRNLVDLPSYWRELTSWNVVRGVVLTWPRDSAIWVIL